MPNLSHPVTPHHALPRDWLLVGPQFSKHVGIRNADHLNCTGAPEDAKNEPLKFVDNGEHIFLQPPVVIAILLRAGIEIKRAGVVPVTLPAVGGEYGII
jgi:hypothetical protein